MMRWLKPLAVLVAVTGLAAGWLMLPNLAAKLSFFQARQIEIVGLHYLTEAEVINALDLPRLHSVMDRLDSVRARANRIPGVVRASVERRLPGTLRVVLLEETPIALVMHQGRLVLVDQDNQQLPFDPARSTGSFPIADTVATTTRLLARVLLADPIWYQEVEAARSEAGQVILDLGAAHRVRLRPDSDLETLDGVWAVRKYLTEQGIPWLEIEGRYLGRVFVRRDLRKDLL